jgi:DMSO reductase anchor subunit
MYPAYSVILLTTSSGAGYGMLFLLGILGAGGQLPPERWLGFVGLALALGLITLGLVASTLHLGRPERSWRALSQWRSSWLSREGVLAVATYLPAGLFAIGWVFLERTSGLWAVAGLLAAAGAILTVYCQSMIYRSLAAIPRWHHPLVPVVFLTMALATGGLWLNAVLVGFGAGDVTIWFCFVMLVFAWVAKLVYWRTDHLEGVQSTVQSATGLDPTVHVALLDAPHVHDNYLLKEMGYRVARKHATRLRNLALLFGRALPLGALLAQLTVGSAALVFAVLAMAAGSFGTIIERWLFFAEARHKMNLYYGDQAV